MIDYRDDGKGMDEETRSHAFEPFYTTNRSSGNTGFGMFIIRKIVYKKLGGTINLDSMSDRGFRMVISFPLVTG